MGDLHALVTRYAITWLVEARQEGVLPALARVKLDSRLRRELKGNGVDFEALRETGRAREV